MTNALVCNASCTVYQFISYLADLHQHQLGEVKNHVQGTLAYSVLNYLELGSSRQLQEKLFLASEHSKRAPH